MNKQVAQDLKHKIAQRVAQELAYGQVVNLGIGLPTLVSNYISDDMEITLQSENGILGMGALALPGEEDTDVTNAGSQFVTVKQGAMFFDSSLSFAMIRGGHVDLTILGALQVDEMGNIASHMVPGQLIPGMGGAMDLISGARKVIVAMQHAAKGQPKIMKKCTLPLTGVGKVNLIVTEKSVIEVTRHGLVLKEILEGSSLEDILQSTDADLIISEDLKSV